MVIRSKVLLIAKYGFLILIVTSVSVFFTSLHFSEEDPETSEAPEDELHYSPNTLLEFSKDMLVENFDACFFEPLSLSENQEKNSSLKKPKEYVYLNIPTSERKERHSPLFRTLIEFIDLMSILTIETVLIEPSILFCILSPQHKKLLLKRNFDSKRFMNLKKVVTLGIREEYVPILEKEEVQSKINITSNFSIEFIQHPKLEWMKSHSVDSCNDSFFTSHMFFKRRDYTVHLVVFYKRENFLWHAALKSFSDENIPPVEELYFSESDSAFDDFTSVFPGFKEDSLKNIRIPSNPQYFLFEMISSKFLECNSSIVARFSKFPAIREKGRSPDSQNSFNRKAILSLQELKARFHPLLINFWIWSGTLLGWYRQCGVIPYTTDVDFAAWASEIDDADHLIQLFVNNKHLSLKQRMGVIEQALEFQLSCQKLRVDIFFTYNELNGTWYAGHRPSKGYFFKYHHPYFTLCSAELLGQKVLVPCESEEVISTEYGPDWMTPVSKWLYEKSIYNRGPNIYWEKSMLKKVYS